MPAQVRRAVLVLWIALGMSVLESLTSIPLDESRPGWAWAASAVMLLAAATLIHLISRRRNWARIVYLVLTALTIAGYVAFAPEMFGAQPWWSAALALAISACDALALYWLFSGAGARWYASQPAA